MATPADIFSAMEAGIQGDKSVVGKIGGVYHFKVGGKSYGVDLKNEATAGVKEAAPEKADCTITVADEDFVALFTGKATGQSLFMKGKLKIQGNMGMAMKLDKLPKAGDAAGAKASGAGESAQAVFDGLAQVLKAQPDVVKQIGGVYKFDLKTSGGQQHWIADLKNGAGSITKGGDGAADCTLTLAEADFVDMFSGKAKAQQLFMKGKLKIKGNMGLAMKLSKLQDAQAKL
jgi:putative sterol carrier protein